MTRMRCFSSALHEAPQPLRITSASSTPTTSSAQTSSPHLAAAAEDSWRLEVAEDRPSEAVAISPRAAHTSLQAQLSEPRPSLVTIRTRLSIPTRSRVRLPRWARSAAVAGGSCGNRIRHPVMSVERGAAANIPKITIVVRNGTLNETAIETVAHNGASDRIVLTAKSRSFRYWNASYHETSDTHSTLVQRSTMAQSRVNPPLSLLWRKHTRPQNTPLAGSPHLWGGTLQGSLTVYFPFILAFTKLTRFAT
jgi:hypothetical protein